MPSQTSRRSELANLVADDDDFLDAFGTNVDQDKGMLKVKKAKPADHMEQLLQNSRVFWVKGRKH